MNAPDEQRYLDTAWARQNVRAFQELGWTSSERLELATAERALLVQELVESLALARNGVVQDGLTALIAALHRQGGMPRAVWEDAPPGMPPARGSGGL